MPTNDITYIRFYGADEWTLPPVTPDQLQSVTSGLRDAAKSVLRLSLGAKFDLDLEFAASPRRGCLEFCFQPQFFLNGTAATGLAGAVLGGLTLDFLWRFVVGDRGIIDLIKRRERPESALARTQMRPEELRFSVSMTQEALRNAECQAAVERLLTVARAGHPSVTSITVEVRDEGEVELIVLPEPPSAQDQAGLAGETEPPAQQDGLPHTDQPIPFVRAGRDMSASWSGVAGRAARVMVHVGSPDEQEWKIFVTGRRIPKEGRFVRARPVNRGLLNYVVVPARPHNWKLTHPFYEAWLETP